MPSPFSSDTASGGVQWPRLTNEDIDDRNGPVIIKRAASRPPNPALAKITQAERQAHQSRHGRNGAAVSNKTKPIVPTTPTRPAPTVFDEDGKRSNKHFTTAEFDWILEQSAYGLTRRTIADLLRVSVSNVSNVVRGKRNRPGYHIRKTFDERLLELAALGIEPPTVELDDAGGRVHLRLQPHEQDWLLAAYRAGVSAMTIAAVLHTGDSGPIQWLQRHGYWTPQRGSSRIT